MDSLKAFSSFHLSWSFNAYGRLVVYLTFRGPSRRILCSWPWCKNKGKSFFSRSLIWYIYYSYWRKATNTLIPTIHNILNQLIRNPLESCNFLSFSLYNRSLINAKFGANPLSLSVFRQLPSGAFVSFVRRVQFLWFRWDLSLFCTLKYTATDPLHLHDELTQGSHPFLVV